MTTRSLATPGSRGYERSWNLSIWIGFVVALLAGLSYIPFFALFPVTRDSPWANLLLFLAAGVTLATGLRKAFRQPEKYRGKISGPILAGLSLFIFGYSAKAFSTTPATSPHPPVRCELARA